MKKQVLANIKFSHSGTSYLARVYKYRPTAIILPDKTVLITNTTVLTTGPRRSNEKDRVRQIFNREGELIPFDLLHRPGDWNSLLEIHFPIAFAYIDP